MAKQKQPRSLTKICLLYLKTLVLSLLSGVVECDLEGYILPSILTQLLDEIMQDPRIDSETKFRALKSFSIRGQTKLTFTCFLHESIFAEIARFLASKPDFCESLRELDLTGVWVKGQARDVHLRKALRRMIELRKLTMKYISDGRLLKVIPESVESLDISGSELSNDFGALTRLTNLKYLNAGYIEGLTGETAAVLLDQIRGLTSLGGFPFAGEAIRCCSAESLQLR